MVDEDDVLQLCRTLPGVVERRSWGRPAWFARTLMARMWAPGLLAVKTLERENLAYDEPAKYFWTPHHERSPQVMLVRLALVADDELAGLLRESYRIAGPPGAADPSRERLWRPEQWG